MLQFNERSQIIKNFLAFNVSFVLLFASLNSSASIQSILNQEGNLGLISQMIVYGVQVLTSLVFPQIVCDMWLHVLCEFLEVVAFLSLF